MVSLSSAYSREVIKADALSQLQEQFVFHATHNSLDNNTRLSLLKQLDELAPAESVYSPFEMERQNAENAALGQPYNKPFIKTPETSLLWAINLAYLSQKEGENFYNSELWNDFSGPDGVAQEEKQNLAFHIASSGMNRQARINWLPLGGTYFFNPENNSVNLDLILSLGASFDIARAAAMHEIAHSKLTVEYPGSMTRARTRLEELLEKGKNAELSKEEHEECFALEREWSIRNLLFDEAENNVVDRWVVNRGPRTNTDYALFRNKLEAIVVDGLIGKENFLDNDTAQSRFLNLKRAIRFSFFRHNGYFPDNEEGWKSIGINPNWISTADGKNGMEALEELKTICGGDNGIEYLQPHGEDLIQGQEWLENKTYEYARERARRVDEIYERFVKPIVKDMPKQEAPPNQQPPQNGNGADNKQGQSSQQNSTGDGDKQQGNNQQQNGSSNPFEPPKPNEQKPEGKSANNPDGQNGEGSGQKDKPEQPKENQGQSGGKPSQEAGDKADGAPADKETGQPAAGHKPKADNQKADNAGASAEKNQQRQPEANGRGKTGDAEVNDKTDNQKTNQNGGDGKETSNKPEDKNKVKVKGKGEKEVPQLPPKNPAEAARKEFERISKARKTADNSQSLEELLKEREIRKAAENENKEYSERDQPPQAKGKWSPANQGGLSNSNTKPRIGDWADYAKAAAEFSSEIATVKRIIDALRERQKRNIATPSYEHELLPEGGDMSRFDRTAHVEMLQGYWRDSIITERSASRFIKDKDQKTPAGTKFVLLMDGSGSMYSKRAASGKQWPFTPIEACMHTACVLNEASKDEPGKERNVSLYGGLFGNATAHMIIKPGDAPETIGKQISGLKHDLNWGTSLSPSIMDTCNILAKETSTKAGKTSGYIHFVIMSDGGIIDENAAYQSFENVLSKVPNATLDFMIIENGKTSLDNLAKKLQEKYTDMRVGVKHLEGTENVLQDAQNLMETRLKMTREVDAKSPTEARRQFADAHRAIAAATVAGR